MSLQKVLVVDEVEANVLFFSVVLGELGVSEVLTATHGAEALELAKKQPVRFVIAAWEMERMPGTLFVQKLRAGKRRHIPYLLYSKRMSAEELKLTQELGLHNVLNLPLERDRALAAIKEILDAETNLSPVEQKLRKIEVMIDAERPSDALKMFDQSLTRKGPHYVRAQTALGRIWLLTGQLAKAEAALKLALAEDPNAFEAASLLANVHCRQERYDEAITMLTKMSAASPKNLTTLLNLGSTYVSADRHDEARDVFATISTLDPDNQDLKDEQAKLAFKEGDLPLAAKLLAETHNGDAIARHFNNLAIALTHKKEFDRAIETYENAIKLLIDKAKLHALRYNLGLALAKKGELQRSFMELAASYKSAPGFEKAYAAMARVAKQMEERGLALDKELVREIHHLRRTHKEAHATQGGGDPEAASSTNSPQNSWKSPKSGGNVA